MTDRELLELAAKAAGVILRDLDDRWDRWEAEPVQIHRGWNPLKDDGDALRLAVKLGEIFPCFMLGIMNRASFPHAFASIVHRNGDETYVEQDDNANMQEITRRAIVRAAAEIGMTRP